MLTQYIRSYGPYWRPFLQPQPEGAPCRRDMDRLVTDQQCQRVYNANLRSDTIDLKGIISDHRSNYCWKITEPLHIKAEETLTPIYTGCPRRNVPEFGRVFLMLKYTDITQNTCPKLNGYGDNGQRSLKL